MMSLDYSLERMITVSINDQPQQLQTGCTLSQVLQQLGYQCEEIAVAINMEFVPRSEYGERVLLERDCVEILAPVQGG